MAVPAVRPPSAAAWPLGAPSVPGVA